MTSGIRNACVFLLLLSAATAAFASGFVSCGTIGYMSCVEDGFSYNCDLIRMQSRHLGGSCGGTLDCRRWSVDVEQLCGEEYTVTTGQLCCKSGSPF